MGRPNRTRVRLRPRLEALEGRAVPSAGRVPAAFLQSLIPEDAQLAEHIHPHLTIIINGQTQAIPAGIGIPLGQDGAHPLHTHDSSGTIHVESTQQLPFRLEDFFTIWGQEFNRHDILGHSTNAHHRLTMTVDGRRSTAFGSLLLQDGQQIVINYSTIPSRRGS
jgi:hypothetical protein